jgi:hypothetical protein
LENFLAFLNNIHDSISFTLELETDRKLNFLDLTIDIGTLKHEFSIFRKPTYTNQVIPADSCHPISHKLASFHSMIHRLINIPMKLSHYAKELHTIKKIAIANGYNTNIIDSILLKKRRKLAINQSTALQPADSVSGLKWCKVPFFHGLSHKVVNSFPKEKLKVSYYTPTPLSKLLHNTKDRFDKTQRSGVYEIICECGASYVGQTGRDFATRIKEHLKRAEAGNPSSMVAKHLIESRHKCTFEANILHIADKGRKLDALEEIEINQRIINNIPLLNEFLYNHKSPLLSIDFS